MLFFNNEGLLTFKRSHKNIYERKREKICQQND